MSFSAEWLALRADADRRARDIGLAERLSAHFAGREGLRILDLGAGTGAMLHATSPLLGSNQYWRSVDRDDGLLARVSAPNGVAVERIVTDLSDGLAPLFETAPDLVTCSAFLDLCGADWLDRLVDHVAATGAAVHAVLSYDGRESWLPAHPLDAAVLAAFHADQRRDKGLGKALGPDAAMHFATALRSHGFEVLTAPSPWRLAAPGDSALIAALARGTAEAVAPALGPPATEWGESRAASTAVMIGHLDLLALPPHQG